MSFETIKGQIFELLLAMDIFLNIFPLDYKIIYCYQFCYMIGQVNFFNLEELKLEQMDNVAKIWKDQLFRNSFSKLEILHVEGCHKISSVFQWNMLKRLENLHELQVKNCTSVEDIFQPEANNGYHDIAAPLLKILKLKGLANMEYGLQDYSILSESTYTRN